LGHGAKSNHLSPNRQGAAGGPLLQGNLPHASLLGDDDDLFSSEGAEQLEEESRAEQAEASLGGLRVIYNGFRDMNDTVKLEALAVMVNLSINAAVADSLVFHQAGDTLTHLLELIWAPGLFTKFATLVVTNLASEEHRRRAILRRGGLAAVVGLLLGSNYELQVCACRCLVNLALSPARHVPLLGTATVRGSAQARDLRLNDIETSYVHPCINFAATLFFFDFLPLPVSLMSERVSRCLSGSSPSWATPTTPTCKRWSPA
jgi:hypothetical protein